MKDGLTQQQMCSRLAAEFGDGWIVNLGVGIPTLCSNADFGKRTITFHAENGVIGYGPLTARGEEDLDLVNAGAQHVTLNPGAAIVHHGDSFALIRSGRVDVTVLGAYEVAANGDFANWRMNGRKGGGIGGAMDLAVGAKRVFIAMMHNTSDGAPRLLETCGLPATARGVVKTVVTNLGLFDVKPTGFHLREIAPGIDVETVKARTGAKLTIADPLPVIAIAEEKTA